MTNRNNKTVSALKNNGKTKALRSDGKEGGTDTESKTEDEFQILR